MIAKRIIESSDAMPNISLFTDMHSFTFLLLILIDPIMTISPFCPDRDQSHLPWHAIVPLPR